jgi:hypothetical protein
VRTSQAHLLCPILPPQASARACGALSISLPFLPPSLLPFSPHAATGPTCVAPIFSASLCIFSFQKEKRKRSNKHWRNTHCGDCAKRYTQHASSNTQHALRNTIHATSFSTTRIETIAQHATRIEQHATSIGATRIEAIAQHATRIEQHATNASRSTQLATRIAQHATRSTH